MSRAYSKSKDKRNINDFYATPHCLTQELINTGILDNKNLRILEPCCGNNDIIKVLNDNGFNNVVGKDIVYGNDFLKDEYIYNEYDVVITNPPFLLFNEIVMKAKEVSSKVIILGRINYFGAHSRNINGVWKNLKHVYIFDRQVAYDRELREDGKVYCGQLITGWFIFDSEYNEDPTISIINIDKYVYRKNEEINK